MKYQLNAKTAADGSLPYATVCYFHRQAGNYADMKRRMGEIASFRPYRKKLCVGMAAAAFLMMAAMLLAVHTHYYARCNESRDILVGKYDGEMQLFHATPKS